MRKHERSWAESTTIDNTKNHYVYTLAYPDGRVFYVGRGKGKRIEQHEKEALSGVDTEKCRIIRSIIESGGEVKKTIAESGLTKREAIRKETELIKHCNYRNLANIQPEKGRSQVFYHLPTQIPIRIYIREQLEMIIEDCLQRAGIALTPENCKMYIRDLCEQAILEKIRPHRVETGAPPVHIETEESEEKFSMPNIIFVQPFTVNAQLAEQCGQRVVVLDVAFNAGSPQAQGTPQEQFAATTGALIESLGDRLALWLDHHPHQQWSVYSGDPRFVLKDRAQAPACPPLITPALVERIGQADTIIAHGDFDGIMSAVKWLCNGKQAYPGLDADSIAADSRVGELSAIGQRYESALKSDLRDDSIRQAIVSELVSGDQEARAAVDRAATKYAGIQAETERLAGLYQVSDQVAWLDASEASGYDLTSLLLAGQKLGRVAVVRNVPRPGAAPQLTVAGPRGWDFVKMFGLSGGMPNRVNLTDRPMRDAISVISQATL